MEKQINEKERKKKSCKPMARNKPFEKWKTARYRNGGG